MPNFIERKLYWWPKKAHNKWSEDEFQMEKRFENDELWFHFPWLEYRSQWLQCDCLEFGLAVFSKDDARVDGEERDSSRNLQCPIGHIAQAEFCRARIETEDKDDERARICVTAMFNQGYISCVSIVSRMPQNLDTLVRILKSNKATFDKIKKKKTI